MNDLGDPELPYVRAMMAAQGFHGEPVFRKDPENGGQKRTYQILRRVADTDRWLKLGEWADDDAAWSAMGQMWGLLKGPYVASR